MTSTELGYLDGVTSGIQGQLNNIDGKADGINEDLTAKIDKLKSNTLPLVWETSYSGATNMIDVAYGNGIFVMVRGTNYVYTSTDGRNWSSHNATGTTTKIISRICYGANKFVGIGTQYIGYSTDGITWNDASTSISNMTATRIKYIGGKYIFAGILNISNNVIYVSTDGITWNMASGDFDKFIRDVAYGNNTYVAVSSGTAYTSTDGLTWTAAGDLGLGSSNANNIVYIYNRFYVGATNGKLTYSTNKGRSWTLLSDFDFGSRHVYACAAGNKLIVYSNGYLYFIPEINVADSFNDTFKFTRIDENNNELFYFPEASCYMKMSSTNNSYVTFCYV